MGAAQPCCSKFGVHQGDTERTTPHADSSDDDDVDNLPEGFLRSTRQMANARGGISAEAYGDWNKRKSFVAPQHPKTNEQRVRLRGILSNNFLFSSLEEQNLELIVGAMKEVVLSTQQRCIQEGDDGDCLFIVEKGKLGCFVKQSDGSENMVREYLENDVFGELSLLYNCPRQASIDGQGNCILWQLDRETFNCIVKDAAQKKRERYEIFLSKVPILSSMDNYDRSRFADALRSEMYIAGQAIVREGDAGDRFYIIEEGTAIASVNGQVAMSYGVGDYFGELALMQNQARVATVIAKSTVKALSIDSVTFKRLMSTLELVERKTRYTY